MVRFHSICLGVHNLTLRRLGCGIAAALSMAGCQEGEMSQLSRGVDATQINSVIDLKEFLPRNSMICAIYPNQDRVSHNTPHYVRINQFLQTSKLNIDEGHWHFVIIRSDMINIETFERSSLLDILASHEVARIRSLLPVGFQPADCVNAESAALYKFLLDDRTYILLGEAK